MLRKVHIRTKIFFIVLVAIIPTIIITLFSSRNFQDSYIHEKSTSLSNLCEGFVNEQRLIIRNGEEMLLAISQTRAVLQRDYAYLDTYFQNLMHTYHNYAVLLAADTDGTVVASGVRQTGYSVADRLYFKRAVLSNSFTIGEFIISKSTGRPTIPLALPVKGDTGNSMVLIATFDIENYYRELSLARLTDGAALEIFDNEGKRLFSSLSDGNYLSGKTVMDELYALAKTGTDSTARRAVLNGVEYLVSCGVVYENQRSIYVTVRIPWRQIKAEAVRPANLILFVMFSSMILAFLLSLFLANVLFVSRIEKLTGHTKLLTEGNLAIRLTPGKTYDEITDLVSSFNLMAQTLEERNLTNQRTIAEKELLLHELQQRISDNLQLLSSMVNLQIEHSSEMNVRHALMTTHSRVMAMALVYETIYRYSDIRLVDMQRFGVGLCEFLVTLYADIGANISCLVSGDEVALPINKALPIALILNEVVSNSIKHAFTGVAHGEIKIIFVNASSSNIGLDIIDNGGGFEGDIHQNDTLGFEMIEALVEQVHGSFFIESKPGGTTVRIRFSSL